jgi:hypothetical protein
MRELAKKGASCELGGREKLEREGCLVDIFLE